MAVQIIDDSTADDGNQTESVAPAPAPEPTPTTPEPHLPEKFKGKSLEDVAKAYEDLERLSGRQSAELGEMRKTYDEFIRSTLTQKRDEKPVDSPAESTDDDTAFFLNPREAIAKAVENHPLVKELREKTTLSQHERNAQTFRAKHPDAESIVKEPEFRQWVEASKVRRELLMRADRDFDVDAADEVFSTWKELRGVKAKQAETDTTSSAEAARKEAVRAGTVPSGNTAPPSDGGKKIYRRVDLIKLQQVDPDRYAAMGDEILQAYLEKRVR